jgi:hypothetical protein
VENKELKRAFALKYQIFNHRIVRLSIGSTIRLLLLAPKRRARVMRSLHEVVTTEPFVKAFFYPLYRTVYYPTNKSEVL